MTKYPKPIVPAAPLDARHDSYSYASVFGYSVVRDRSRGVWLVRTPAGDVLATSATWRRAMRYALAQRGEAA